MLGKTLQAHQLIVYYVVLLFDLSFRFFLQHVSSTVNAGLTPIQNTSLNAKGLFKLNNPRPAALIQTNCLLYA